LIISLPTTDPSLDL